MSVIYKGKLRFEHLSWGVAQPKKTRLHDKIAGILDKATGVVEPQVTWQVPRSLRSGNVIFNTGRREVPSASQGKYMAELIPVRM